MPLEDENIINCPACGKKMKKIYMPDQDVNLDVCLDGCGGIYFDNREFNMFKYKKDDITPLIKAYKNKTFKEVSGSDLRVCPACGMKMVKNRNNGVVVDDCYQCGGKFLDYKELEKIRTGLIKDRYKQRPVIISPRYDEALDNSGLLEPIPSIPVTNEYLPESETNFNPCDNSHKYYEMQNNYRKILTAYSIMGMIAGAIVWFALREDIRTYISPLISEINLSRYINADIVSLTVPVAIGGISGFLVAYKKFHKM